VKVTSLIYCHRIDADAVGLTIRNLRMFEKVCNLELKNTFIVTTFWDVVGNDKGAELEQQLVTNEQYFKSHCDAGATTFNHNNTPAIARRFTYQHLERIPINSQMQTQDDAREGGSSVAAGST
jgi:hypothetical protein